MELMHFKQNKPDNIIIPKNNAVDLFSKDYKKGFNSKEDNNNTNVKKTINNNKIKLKKQKQKNIKNINPNSTPVEFYYEFKDYIKVEQPKPKQSKKNEIKNLKQSITNKVNNQNNNSEKKERAKDKNNSNKKSDIYLQKVKYYMLLKNKHLNKLTNKVRMDQYAIDEEKKLNKKLNKSSILICPTNRKPLYQYHNINDDSLSKDFDCFYKYHQKEQKINNNKLYKKKNNIYDFSNNSFNNNDKFQKFYENKMDWTKRRDNKIKNKKNMIEEQDKKKFNSFSFKPKIDKKSIQLINKRNKFIDFMENKSFTDRNYNNSMINKKEIYQRYCATIRPYISFYYENNSPFYKNNKYKNKNLSFTKRKSSVDIGMIHINKGKNIKIIKEKKDNSSIDNNSKDKDKEKHKIFINKKNIFNMFKPEKKEIQKKINNNTNKNKNKNKNKSKNNINNNKSKNKQKMWWNEIKDKNFNSHKNKGKYFDWNELYKVNVRDNSSWNKACLNKIISKPKYNQLIQDFI